MLFGVSINCEKVLRLRFLVSTIIFVDCMDSNFSALYSLHPRQHIGYPQHLTKWYRNCSKEIWIEFNKIFKSNFWLYYCRFCSTQRAKIQWICSKKLLFEILLISLWIALESVLRQFMRCCGYLTCSPRSREQT